VAAGDADDAERHSSTHLRGVWDEIAAENREGAAQSAG